MPCLRTAGDAVLLNVKVTPRASRNEIGGLHGEALKVKVTAPPVDSAANEAVVELLANALGCSRQAVHLVRGATARHKQIAINGITAKEIARRLGLG
jgi:uncharacterized protein